MNQEANSRGGAQRRPASSFFGRRKGHELKNRQARLWDSLLPELQLDPFGGPAPDDLTVLFPTSVESVNLEIGFGGGEHLARQAQDHPETGFIGVEPFINGLAKMLGEVDGRGLNNVRLYGEDAAILLDWLPPASLSRVDLLYPDPWPKKKHWKRRFVNVKNLERIARVIEPGGLFRFASDIDTYVNWTLQHIARQEALRWTAKQADDWRQPWDVWHRTRYEAKAIREGRTPAYLVFERVS
ncbi:MAG: tRNA (guanosine(46)-N7)-methyltransferase TrmB [Pseudomonadota bacterium]